jgi:methyl-accepting chemotaxis protein
MNTLTSISAKLMFAAALAVAGSSIAITAVMVRETQVRVQSIVMDQAEAKAEAIANNLLASLETVVGAAQSTAGMIEQSRDNVADRVLVKALLKTNAERFKLAFGSWFADAGNVFDGKAGQAFIDNSLAAKDGNFNVYWTRVDDVVSAITFDSDFSAVWYRGAAESKKGSTSEPYIEPTTHKSMTTIAYPVMDRDTLVGVHGVDVLLDELSAHLAELHPFATGNVYLVSQAGNWLVAPESSDLLTPYEGPGKEAIGQDKAGSSDVVAVVGPNGQEFQRLIFPFNLPTGDGKMDDPSRYTQRRAKRGS